MNGLKIFLIVLVGISFFVSKASYTEEQATKGTTSAGWGLIKDLNSSDPETRGRAALALGDSGKMAISAIPHLIDLLDDSTALIFRAESFNPNERGVSEQNTSPGREAAIALVKIGWKSPKDVVPAIIEFMKVSKNSIAKGRAAQVLRVIGVPSDFSLAKFIEKNSYLLTKNNDPAAFQAAMREAEERRYQDYKKMKKWWDKNKESFQSPNRDRDTQAVDFSHEGKTRLSIIPY